MRLHRDIVIKLALLAAASATVAGCLDNGSKAPSVPSLGTVTPTLLPTGVAITPTAAPGSVFTQLNPGLKDLPAFVAGQAVSEAVSPDGKTLLILTSGYNNNGDNKGNVIPADSNEYVFVYDISGAQPVQKQVLLVADTYVGIAFSPDGARFYVSGGGDDNLHTFALSNGAWVESGSPIALGHGSANGLGQSPMAGGLAVTADSKRVVVANRYNDSITIVDVTTGKVVAEQDLRPGKSGGQTGQPGGEYPNSVAIVGNTTAYVSSERDREIVVVDISGAAPRVTGRIPVNGNPNKMVLNKAQTTLYAASDNADVVSVIDTAKNVVTGTIQTVAPSGALAQMKYRGASPNALALSQDETTLYVTNGGTNSVAVIALNQPQMPVTGLIPTGWSPSAVAVGAGGGMLYVVNVKSIKGPNPGNCLGYQTVPCPVKNSPVSFVPNQYVENLSKAGFLSVPVPDAGTLGLLTQQVASNNNFNAPLTGNDAATMAALRSKINHVIYIIKENRTYDQVLGDLGKGNGSPQLAEFPKATTPNLHALANNFVTLDNFYDAGEVSGNGWPWSTSGRESDAGVKMLPVNYACSPLGGAGCSQGRGGSYDWEGTNRNINVGLAGPARSAANPLTPSDPDLLPGTGNAVAPDGPNGEVQQGYLWNAASRAGLSVRNYGMFIDLGRYSLDGTANAALEIPRDRNPFANKVQQATAANADLVNITNPYFRGFDPAYPDFYREQEWEREFNQYVTNGNLPALSLVRLMGDHTGSYKAAIDGVNTPEIQVADNDYAVGKLIQAVANSPYAANTLIFIVEDDAQDGPDHVDAQRSTAHVVGPYVKQGTVVSTHYTTLNVLRTITEVLGMDHLSLFDANQGPMTDVFDLTQQTWSFKASPSGLLKSTQLPIPATLYQVAAIKPTHSAKYWIAKTKHMDFSEEDKVDALAYNRILWEGLMGKKPYPARKNETMISMRSEGKRSDGVDD